MELSLPPFPSSEILRRDNNNPDALYAKALSYYYQDMQDKANAFFQRALRSDPDHQKSRLAIKVEKLLSAVLRPFYQALHFVIFSLLCCMDCVTWFWNSRNLLGV